MPRYDEHELGDRRGLPVTEFLYTFDQIAYVLNMKVVSVRGLIWFNDLPSRKQEWSPHLMVAHNILPSDLHKQKEWRVPESELIRYLEHKGLLVYERRLSSGD